MASEFKPKSGALHMGPYMQNGDYFEKKKSPNNSD